jgi:hypothetical protein
LESESVRRRIDPMWPNSRLVNVVKHSQATPNTDCSERLTQFVCECV